MKRTLLIIALLASFTAGLLINSGSHAESKPLTTIGLAKTLLLLAEKAEKQEMRVEAEAIKGIIPTILTGTPANQIKPSTALCDTDANCAKLEKELKKQQTPLDGSSKQE